MHMRNHCWMPYSSPPWNLGEEIDFAALIVDSILRGSCHPVFTEYFRVGTDGMIQIDSAPRTQFGGKRVKRTGTVTYNMANSIAKDNCQG